MTWFSRRELLGGVMTVAAAGSSLSAETSKIYRVSLVSASSPISEISENAKLPVFPAFLKELRRLGYVEGKNLIVLRHSAEGKLDRHDAMIRETVAETPDAILVPGVPLALGFKAATKTIPLVVVTTDPLSSGLVSSLARPGGNITGLSLDAGVEVWGKRIGLLRDLVPTASRVGVLTREGMWLGAMGDAIRQALARNSMSQVGGLQETFQTSEYESIIRTFQEEAQVVVVDVSPENLVHRNLIVELLAKSRLPAVYGFREFVDVGGLISYGPDFGDLFRRAAGYVDRILQGAYAGDIPIDQATKFNLVINLKSAGAAGLEVPPTLLAQANDIVE
jgi:putative ABC transport system substrate-binding protein